MLASCCLGPFLKVGLKCPLCLLIQGDRSLRMSVEGTDSQLPFFFPCSELGIVQLKSCQFSNSYPCLKKKLNDGVSTNIATDSVAESAVFSFGKDSGGLGLKFGVGNESSGIVGDILIYRKKAEEGFDGVCFSRDGLGSVALFKEFCHKGFNIFLGDLSDIGLFKLLKKLDQLADIFPVSQNCGVGSVSFLQVLDELLMRLL